MIMTKLNEIICGSGKGSEVKVTNSSSCGVHHQNHPGGEPSSKRVFKCRSKCEGDKTYKVSGFCPVCNSPLTQVAELHQNYYL